MNANIGGSKPEDIHSESLHPPPPREKIKVDKIL
jgi:hypothetical protein